MITNPTPEDLLANLKTNPHPKQTDLRMTNGYAYVKVDGVWIGYDGQSLYLGDDCTTPLFATVNLHQEIDRAVGLAQKMKDHVLKTDTKEQVTMTDQPEQTFVSTDRYRELEAELSKVTASRDEAQKKNDFINGQMSDLLAEREGLFAKIRGLTEEGDRLKSKAGLLSVVCRRLCGDENASIEEVHAAIDLCHDQANTIDFIGERVGSDPDTTIPNRFSEIRSLVAQAVKSLGEKTVEVAKLQEGLTNYKAHVEGLTKRLEQMTFERDTERVGKKWLSETVEDLKRTTAKLPNEHTLRRLFNRHNAPDKYDNGEQIPTIERLLLIIENLCRNADCAERRFDELNAISTRVNTESEDAHATLDEMGIPRWTTANNHNERYLSLSARIRSVFQTHTKV